MYATEQASRRLVILLVTMIGTFLVLRLAMMFRPNADFFIGSYNIHHLYTGVLLAAACIIPLVVGMPRPPVAEGLVGGLGVGLSLALDEVVYLIMTDGSNRAYLSRESFVGGVTLIALASVYAAVMFHLARRRISQERTTATRRFLPPKGGSGSRGRGV